MKKSENSERDKWFREIMEPIPDATIFVNERCNFCLVNMQAEELFGHPRHELIDLAVEMLVPDEIRAGAPCEIAGHSRLGHYDPLRVVHSRLFCRMVPTTRCTTKNI